MTVYRSNRLVDYNMKALKKHLNMKGSVELEALCFSIFLIKLGYRPDEVTDNKILIK